MKKKTEKQPQDATTRNVKSANKKFAALEARVKKLEIELKKAKAK